MRGDRPALCLPYPSGAVRNANNCKFLTTWDLKGLEFRAESNQDLPGFEYLFLFARVEAGAGGGDLGYLGFSLRLSELQLYSLSPPFFSDVAGLLGFRALHGGAARPLRGGLRTEPGADGPGTRGLEHLGGLGVYKVL